MYSAIPFNYWASHTCGGFDKLNHHNRLSYRNAVKGTIFCFGSLKKCLRYPPRGFNHSWWFRQAQPPQQPQLLKNPADETRSLSLWLLSLSKHRSIETPAVGKSSMVVVSTSSTTTTAPAIGGCQY